jgi:hypothetical protein
MRTGYALSRAVITRSDSGAEVFNASEIVGAGHLRVFRASTIPLGSAV